MKCILFTGVVAAFFVFGEALRCYHTVGIDKPFNKNDLSISCAEKPDRCVKTTMSFNNGTTLDVRTCLGNMSHLPPEINNVIAKFLTDPKYLAGGCQVACDTDNCNGSQSIIAVLSIILASLFISIFVCH